MLNEKRAVIDLTACVETTVWTMCGFTG